MIADLPSHEHALEIYLADLLTENVGVAFPQESQASQAQVAAPHSDDAAVKECAHGEPQYASDLTVFDVSGISYALPAETVGAIHRDFAHELAPVETDAAWYLGIFYRAGQAVHVVDVTGWADPLIALPREESSYSHVIELKNSQVALACHALTINAKLDRAGAIWRKKAGKRAWLAGFVKEPACALLLAEPLIRALEQSLTACDQQKK
ncbi:MAG: hypothetical protein ACRCWB_04590 [Enterovibrio sp.]